MGQDISGGGNQEEQLKLVSEKLTKGIVLNDVHVVKKMYEVQVPELVSIPREQVQWVTVEKEQVKYKTVEEKNLKYVPKEEQTIIYVPVEQATTKYIPKEVVVECPKLVEKEYEKPIVVEKEYEVVKPKDLEAIKQYATVVPELTKAVAALAKNLVSITEEIQKLKVKAGEFKNIKLVEELIRVPKIDYVPTTVERIVWKDIPRERIVERIK